MEIEHTGILQIHVSVTDVERSVEFYRDVLGLRHLFTVQGQPMAATRAHRRPRRDRIVDGLRRGPRRNPDRADPGAPS